MKISRQFDRSKVKKIFDGIFVDSRSNLFEKSLVMKVLSCFDNQFVSLGALVLSIICLLYKSLLVGTFIDQYNIWFVFLLVAMLTCSKKAVKSYRSSLFLMAFVFVGLASAILAAINGVPLMIILNGIFLSAIFPLFFIVASTYNKKLSNILPYVIIIICTPLLLAGIWHLISGVATPAYWVSPAENLIKLRIFGWSENPNNLGALAMITGLVALFLAWSKKRWYLIIYTILAVVVMILTFSRASWLGFFAGITVALLIKNWRLIWLSSLSLIGLLIPSVRQRLLSTFDARFLSDSVIDGRLWSLGSISDIFKNSPIIGIGPGTYGNTVARDYVSPAYAMLSQGGFVSSFMVDMQWPQILCQFGIVGILCVAGFFVSYFINIIREYFKSKSVILLGSMAILVAMLVAGFLENVWFFAPMSSLYGVLLGLGINYGNNR